MTVDKWNSVIFLLFSIPAPASRSLALLSSAVRDIEHVTACDLVLVPEHLTETGGSQCQ